MNKYLGVLEGLLFVVGDEGLTIEQIKDILEVDDDTAKELVKLLRNRYEEDSYGIQLSFLGNSFKLTTKKEHKDYYKKLAMHEENSTLSESALETLAIIAYNAPLTRVDIDGIRGVNSSYVVRKLLLKGLIEEVGRSDAPGRPRLYNITPRFLDYFGLGSIDELPKLEEKDEVIDEEKYLFESKYKEEI